MDNLENQHAIRVEDLSRFPYHLEKAIRMSMYGKPGPVYIEIPGDIMKSSVVVKENFKFPQPVPQAPIVYANQRDVDMAVKAFQTAKKPLVIGFLKRVELQVLILFNN